MLFTTISYDKKLLFKIILINLIKNFIDTTSKS